MSVTIAAVDPYRRPEHAQRRSARASHEARKRLVTVADLGDWYKNCIDIKLGDLLG